MNHKNVDVLLMSDNGLNTVGGEQESTKVIISNLKEYFSLGIIQPGIIKNPLKEVTYFRLTNHTRIKHLVTKPISFINYIVKVKNNINKSNPRVIHTQAQVSFFIISILKKLKLISKDSYIIHTERGLYSKYNIFFKKLFIFFMSELDILVTTTKFNMKLWKNALNDKGLTLEYKIIENTAGDLFETYDYSLDKKKNNNFVIGFAGRYTDWKDWPLAMEISEQLNKKIGQQLYVKMAVGCLDKKALKETEEMFSKMKNTFGDRFNGEININLEAMNRFYYDLDVFVLTSKYNTESFGRTLVEAMSRKTVVLTTDAGGSVEVVGNEANVCYNASDFAKKIFSFYQDETKMDGEKEYNLLRVKNTYSLKNNINKHLELYESCFK